VQSRFRQLRAKRDDHGLVLVELHSRRQRKAPCNRQDNQYLPHLLHVASRVVSISMTPRRLPAVSGHSLTSSCCYCSEFPQLLRRGAHSGLIRTRMRTGDQGAECRLLTADSGVVRPDQPDNSNDGDFEVQRHCELEQHIQHVNRAMGMVQFVHPHPRLSGMICLCAGQRRWAPRARHFKTNLARQAVRQGRRKAARASIKWRTQSHEVAEGLALLQWRELRRVMGLTPWSEQVLLRLKHHALSTYNPVSAVMHQSGLD
jgi:hypothetical protein